MPFFPVPFQQPTSQENQVLGKKCGVYSFVNGLALCLDEPYPDKDALTKWIESVPGFSISPRVIMDHISGRYGGKPLPQPWQALRPSGRSVERADGRAAEIQGIGSLINGRHFITARVTLKHSQHYMFAVGYSKQGKLLHLVDQQNLGPIYQLDSEVNVPQDVSKVPDHRYSAIQIDAVCVWRLE